MDETKTYVFGDGADKGINPALLALLNQNGGFGNGAPSLNHLVMAVRVIIMLTLFFVIMAIVDFCNYIKNRKQ